MTSADLKGSQIRSSVTNASAARESNAPGPAEVCQMLMDQTPLPEGEDKQLYQMIYQSVIDKLNPQSILDGILAMEYVNRLFDTLRWRKSTTIIIDNARGLGKENPKRVRKIANLVSEAEAANSYLKLVQPLSQLADNGAAAADDARKRWQGFSFHCSGIQPEDGPRWRVRRKFGRTDKTPCARLDHALRLERQFPAAMHSVTAYPWSSNPTLKLLRE
jgi:hypothetical protein